METTKKKHSIKDIAIAVSKTRRPRSLKSTNMGIRPGQHYLERRQVATYLGVSMTFVIDRIKAGELREYVFGPFCRRYSVTDLEAYCAARLSPKPSPKEKK